jgi:hypothetical protein
LIRTGIAAGMGPDEATGIILDGIRARRLHILTHPETRALVTMRAEDIAADLPLRDMFGRGVGRRLRGRRSSKSVFTICPWRHVVLAR